MSDVEAGPTSSGELWTIGHMEMPLDYFIGLLRERSITAVVDVRPVPYRQRWPDYNREALRPRLAASGMTYVYLGRELGGRPLDPKLWGANGVPDVPAITASSPFQDGLAQLTTLARAQRTAVMSQTSLGDPRQIRRARLLISALRQAGWLIHHIPSDYVEEETPDQPRRLSRRVWRAARRTARRAWGALPWNQVRA